MEPADAKPSVLSNAPAPIKKANAPPTAASVLEDITGSRFLKKLVKQDVSGENTGMCMHAHKHSFIRAHTNTHTTRAS